MNSALYFGTVAHRRFAPVRNDFRYRMFQVYLDLAEVDQVFRGRWMWSARRWAPAWFRRADHLGDPARPLDECVRDQVEAELGFRPAGPIRLLTHLRYWGYCMNPVSFFYCFAPAAGAPEVEGPAPERLTAIVAEVHNTPWGERHCYVLDCRAPVAAGGVHAFQFAKAFHVSPFMPMAMDYAWRFQVPGDEIRVHMRNLRDGEPVFEATQVMERRPITTANLAWALSAHPFMTGVVIAAIYWQALRLWLKRAPHHPHPGPARGNAAG